MLVVASIGLVVNVVAWRLLRPGAAESLTVEGAYLEVVADLIGSLAVIVAAAPIAVDRLAVGGRLRRCRPRGVDPAPGVAPRPAGAPRPAPGGAPGLDLAAVRSDLAGVDGVVDVHDLHVWTLTSEMDVASAHVMVSAGTDAHAVLDRARSILADRYGVSHATLQVEPDDHTGCEEVTW